MRVKCDRRCGNIAGYCTNHDPKFILSRIGDPHRLHLLDQQLADLQLPWSTGVSFRGLTGGGINFYVLQKAV